MQSIGISVALYAKSAEIHCSKPIRTKKVLADFTRTRDMLIDSHGVGFGPIPEKEAHKISNLVILCAFIQQLMDPDSFILFKRERFMGENSFVTTWPTGYFLRHVVLSTSNHTEITCGDAPARIPMGIAYESFKKNGSMSDDSFDLEGWIWKEGFFNRNYRRRYFRLRGNILRYYADDHLDSKEKGSINVATVKVVPVSDDNGPNRSFNLHPNCLVSRTFRLRTDTIAEKHAWINALSRVTI